MKNKVLSDPAAEHHAGTDRRSHALAAAAQRDR
jgi:hypothetical protein